MKLFLLSFILFALSCSAQQSETSEQAEKEENKPIVLGAEQRDLYEPLLEGKRVGVVSNHTGVIMLENEKMHGDKRVYAMEPMHIVDLLLPSGINVKKIFAPEHGFRGKADAGEQVKDGKDVKTGLPIISLYGKNKKPTPEQLTDVDIILFDMQDVGVRFYTYISTLTYVMEAAAEQGIPVVVLDRPNPNGHYIDGPVLEAGYESFVGMHKVPVVYGMTIGEYARMVNGERWLKNGIQCDLTVIPLENYTHNMPYELPVKPSPNLPNAQAINLYPSLCFFEGTNVSVGRGTNMQFQIYGSPYLPKSSFTFTPKPNEGAKYPKHNNQLCFGENLQNQERMSQLYLSWLIEAYQANQSQPFFNKNLFFDTLAGTNQLRKQIIAGKTEEEIRQSWQRDIEQFKQVRAKYLLY